MPKPRPAQVVTLMLGAAAATMILLPGCHNPGGRIDINQTTQAERDSSKVLPTALIEFSDQAPQRLVAELKDLPLIKNTKGPVTILLGDINNKTGIVSSNEFELAAQRLRNNLLNSTIARGKLNFVENRARMARLAAKEGVGSADTPAKPPAYAPDTTYTLLGDFYRIGRGDTNQYYMQFQLVNFATNEIVFSDRFDVKQVKGD